MTRVAGALLALLLACSGLLLVAAPAQAACTCTDRGVRQDADSADAVFTGSVRETVKPDAGQGGRGEELFTYVVDVDRVYQQEGTVVTQTVRISSARPRACGLGNLPAGTAYVFFAKARDTGFRAGSCGGSGPVADELVADVERVLDAGREVTPETETHELELTSVESSPPQSATRLAAPGAAIALLGLLGLMLVRLTGSRR
jgi:hypothetical protein